MFPIKNGLKKRDVLLPLLFNLALDYAVRRIQVNQDGLKLNGTYQSLVYADDFNMLGGSVYTTKKNTEALLVASKESGLEVTTYKAKYMAMPQVQNAERIHNIQTHNISFEKVEQFKYLGKIQVNKNYNHEEIKSRLKTGNAYYYSVQNLLSSSVLSNNIKIKIYRTIILPVVLHGCEIWPVTLWEKPRLSVFENRVLRRICGPKRD